MNFLDYLLQDNVVENTKGGFYYPSTFDANLDFFAGLSRYNDKEKIDSVFQTAYDESRELALANLLYTLDIRHGRGERNLFKIAFKALCNNHPEDAAKVLPFISELGRFDYVLEGVDTPIEGDVFELIRNQWNSDLVSDHPSLLAKWLPSLRNHIKNSDMAHKVRKALGLKEKEYRKGLSLLRTKLDIVEKKMTEKDYASICYESVPTKAMLKHNRAFANHDAERYSSYLSAVKEGKKEIKTEGLFCYEVVKPLISRFGKIPAEERNTLQLMWDNQKDFLADDKGNALVVADVSGSMTSHNCLPLASSVGLSLYIAKRNKGAFHDYVMTFSENPTLVRLGNGNIEQLVHQVLGIHWGMSTQIDKVFDRILKAALKAECPQSELPEMIYIISDMEFDSCANRKQTNFQHWKEEFSLHGYTLPKIVFWNVAGSSKGVPVSKYEGNVILVSGYSTSVLECLKNADSFNPTDFMVNTLRPYAKMLFSNKNNG